MSKRSRSTNFSSLERQILTEIISSHPIIEDKRKSMDIERKKTQSWDKIMNDFNANETVTKRSLDQLKVK